MVSLKSGEMLSVNGDYEAPFDYPGRIHTVLFELPSRRQRGDEKAEAEAQARAALTRQ